MILGPVLIREGGYAFDAWTPENRLRRGYVYRRIQDAHYARKAEIKFRARSVANPMIACSTFDEIRSALAKRQISLDALVAPTCGQFR